MQNKTKSLFINYITAMFLLINLFFLSFSVNADDSINKLEQLQQEIINIQKTANLPALGIAIIDKGEKVWVTSLGKANVAKDTPVDENSLFRIGSISKMFVALAVLKLVEEGKLNLDDKIRDLVPEIEFENQWQDTHPVRLVHLLEHTTGWGDMTLVEYAHTEVQPIVLKEALTLFTKARKSRWPAGTRHAYSNIGPAVAGYIVEKTTGILFEDYVEKNFFTPLGMVNTTYFQPDVNKVMTTAYFNGEAQDYWPLIYRPSGAINSSPAEMVNFLQFFLHQGQFAGQKLISVESLQRMETPKTTLGSAEGITAGYGLANYTSGYEELNTVFHGHDGAVTGAMASLNYTPALNSGYVLMYTGDGSALYQVSELIKAYLLRDVTPIESKNAELPDTFKNLNGYYKKINPRNHLESIANDLFNFMVFTSDENNVHRSPFFGGWLSSDYGISENLLTNPWSGLPSIAMVNDPLVGKAIQVESVLYVPVSAISVWAKIIFIAMVVIASCGALLFALFWLPLNLYRKSLTPQQIKSRLWPTLNGALFIAFVLLSCIVGADIDTISKISPFTLSLLFVSIIYALVVIYSFVPVWQLKAMNASSKGYWLSFSICIIHLLNVFLLASYGMIGVRIWLL